MASTQNWTGASSGTEASSGCLVTTGGKRTVRVARRLVTDPWGLLTITW